jgi:hypothetical protein
MDLFEENEMEIDRQSDVDVVPIIEEANDRIPGVIPVSRT